MGNGVVGTWGEGRVPNLPIPSPPPQLT